MTSAEIYSKVTGLSANKRGGYLVYDVSAAFLSEISEPCLAREERNDLCGRFFGEPEAPATCDQYVQSMKSTDYPTYFFLRIDAARALRYTQTSGIKLPAEIEIRGYKCPLLGRF